MTTTPGCLACVIWGSNELQWSMKLLEEESRALRVCFFYACVVWWVKTRMSRMMRVQSYYYRALLNFRERTVRFVWFKVWFKGTGALGGMCDQWDSVEACPDVRVGVILRNGDHLKAYSNISKHVQTYRIKLVSEQCHGASAALLHSTPVTGLGGWRGRSREWIPLTELPPSCLCYIILLIHRLDFFFLIDTCTHTNTHC